MKYRNLALIATLGTTFALAGVAQAGSISYTKVTNDLDSGIDSSNTYTHAIDFESSGTTATINGVAFASAGGDTANFTRTVANGTLNNHHGTGVVSTSENLANLMQGFLFNASPATDGSGLQTYTITGLSSGTMYDMRVYSHNWGNPGSRFNTLVFDAGGANDSTGSINQDDSTTVGFATTDSYYINYRFVADSSSLTFTAANASGSDASWHLYGLSNQVVTNLISNGSFENGVAANTNGNNIGHVPVGWSTTASNWNVVRVDGPGGGSYGGGPQSGQDGDQYLDLTSDGELFQTFTLPETATLSFGAWFSNRESNNDNSPSTVGIYDETGTTLLSTLAAVNLFGEATPSTDWTQAEATIVDLAAGTYQIRIDLNNYNNVDSVFVNVVPEPSSLALLGLGGLLLARRQRG